MLSFRLTGLQQPGNEPEPAHYWNGKNPKATPPSAPADIMQAPCGSRQRRHSHNRTKEQYRDTNLRVDITAGQQVAHWQVFEVDGIRKKNMIQHPHHCIGDKEEEKKKPKLSLARSPLEIKSPPQTCQREMPKVTGSDASTCLEKNADFKRCTDLSNAQNVKGGSR